MSDLRAQDAVLHPPAGGIPIAWAGFAALASAAAVTSSTLPPPAPPVSSALIFVIESGAAGGLVPLVLKHARYIG